jgi:adhesin/invasin
MQNPRWGWQASAWLLVSLGIVGIGMMAGCEKVGGGNQGEQAAPSSASSTTPAPTPTVVGINLTAGSATLAADGASSTTITATLVTSTGATAPDGIAVTFTTDLGRFTTDGAKSTTATTSQGTGAVVVPFISEPGVVGTASVVASAQGITQSVKITLAGVGASAPPAVVDVASITMTADATSLVANGTSSTTITAALITSQKTPAPDGIVVTFTTDKGRFTTDGAKSATATTGGGTGTVLVPFISESDVVGTATIVANVKGVVQSLQIALTGAGAPARVLLTADATSISLGGTTGITAEVLDADGNKVADGTAVSFTTSLKGTGVTSSATTTSGIATALFSAGTAAGVATVTATASPAVAAVSITIQPGSAGSLGFVSANPTAIGVTGSPLPQVSTITFQAFDRSGNPVADGTVVTFTLVSGVGGGEFVAPVTAGTIGGQASTILTSGRVSGPVRVSASVTVTDSVTGKSTTFSSSSTNVSIEGGPPSAPHFGVAPGFLNIAGQVTQGILCPLDAAVADRFGNPVPVGTAVSFFTNGGLVCPQAATDEHGDAASLECIKTLPPIPHVGSSIDPTDPRTGMVTIVAVTQGEEGFIDTNGNGLFDGPQEFDSSLDTPEPFIDHVTQCSEQLPNGTTRPCQIPADPSPPKALTGNGQFDPTDPFELFIDGNGNGVWDGPNGLWDANKPIFASTRVLFSGPTVLRVTRLQSNGSCSGDPNGFTAPNGGGSPPFCILVSDPGGHPLVSGTKLTVTTSAGTIAGTSNVTFPDTQLSGPGSTQFVFNVIDDDPTTIQTRSATVTVTVNSPSTGTCPGGNGDAQFTFAGTIDAP